MIARDPENLYGFTIGVGSLSGVEENDPVITAAGLVGLVTSVSPTYSQVTTVLSPDLQISAYDTRTGSAGVVCGRADLAVFAECQMQHLDKDAGVSSGDLIATSGSSSLFPADIVIGSVSEVTISENGMSATLTIQPSVDVQSVTDVTVIKSFTGQGSGLQ